MEKSPTTQWGYAVVALDNPKNTLNVGSALRASICYGAVMLVTGGVRNKYRRAPTDTSYAHKHIPLIMVPDVFDCLPHDCVPVAVEMLGDALDLVSYVHPERAFYIFGAEDATYTSTPSTRESAADGGAQSTRSPYSRAAISSRRSAPAPPTSGRSAYKSARGDRTAN